MFTLFKKKNIVKFDYFYCFIYSIIHIINKYKTIVEATYAVPEHKNRENRENRETIMERRRRSSTPGARLTLPVTWNQDNQWQQPWLDNSNNVRNWTESNQKWDGNNTEYIGRIDGRVDNNGWDGERWNNNWGEVPTPTVHVDMNAAYWRGNASVADSSDNGGKLTVYFGILFIF